jgi:predicted DNA-binding transcriptional regulator AlpA
MMKQESKIQIQYVNERIVSELTGIALPTLRNYRHQGQGPDYVKAGSRAIRYRLDDVISYMEKGRVTHEAKK